MFQSLISSFTGGSVESAASPPLVEKVPERIELNDDSKSHCIKSGDLAIERFFLEVKSDSSQNGWDSYCSSEKLSIWKKLDENSGVYCLKLVGCLPFPCEVVQKILFDNSLRMAWDTVLEEVRELQSTLPDGRSLLYISMKTPIGISYRDFVHLRSNRENVECGTQGSNAVVDISVDKGVVPEREGYVRGHTFMSGGLFEPIQMDCSSSSPGDASENANSNATLIGCRYSMLSEVDIKGNVPKSLVNAIIAKSTIDWFDSLSNACDLFQQGKLIPNPNGNLGGWLW